MYRRKRTTTLVVIFLMLLAAMVYVLWSASSSRADGPPDDTTVSTPTDDPCFRTDPECYEPRQVECANNVFVPMNPDGTWTCPGEQLPEERIGGARGDCPDAPPNYVGYVVDVEGHIVCLPPADQVSRGGTQPYFEWMLQYVVQLLRILLGFA